jgi:hypothetical protein
MPTKGGKQSEKGRAAGAANLAKYHRDHPGRRQSLKHGAHSHATRKRYNDMRTREGRQLKAVIGDLVSDLGGQENVSAAQNLLLQNVRTKLIVLMSIGQYAERQESIIDDEGKLLPCLGRNYTAFAEGLRRDLEALYSMAAKRPSRLPTISEIIGGK